MFDIVSETADFVVINKHPNVSVHKDDGETMLVESVATAIGCPKLFLVHRLDKMTSGLLLLAKTSTSAAALSELFAKRKVEKFYLAIGDKKPKKKQGLVCGDMSRSRRSAWKLNTSQENPAVTQFFSKPGEPGQRVFLCKPYTGKTHQIRVALKSVGSAIVGDPIYAPSSQADRGYLHAYSLGFEYLGEQHRFCVDPTQYSLGELWRAEPVKIAITQWHQPWQLPWPTLPQSITG
ncbi:TIGR01621 family pseudouridine synthase [Vibrio sp. WXL103]|uniref:TIGR01621 family pseudouridine synthase n=1 Tax=Vibrio sp. WXL103 TaxID=3450710 RepID=UPI003EC57DF5